MNRLKFVILSLAITTSLWGNDKKNGTVLYIDAYVDIAISEMERTGIPASIKLAQAILESNAGRSEMAIMANNHFGIKCGNEWRGASYYKLDDDKDHRGRLVESCFRVYKDASESFIAHSTFLQNKGKPSRYSFLFDYNNTEYKKWARGLKKAGYATDPHYPQKLINLIEKYELHRYDRMGSADHKHLASKPASKKEPSTQPKIVVEEKESRVPRDTRIASKLPKKKMPRTKMINEAKVAISKGEESLNDISNNTGIPLASLLAFNEDLFEPYENIPRDSKIYLEPKRLSLKGKQKFHTVKKGESMADISQEYGVELEALYIRNRIPFGSQVAKGEKIQLKGIMRTGAKPKIIKQKKNGIVERSRFVEETVEYIFRPKNGKKD